MTAKEFIQEIEAYYGRYEREATRGYVYAWAAEVEYALEKLWPVVMKEFTGQYGKQPDIANLERIAEENFTAHPYNAWGDSQSVHWRRALRPKVGPEALPGPGVISQEEYDRRIAEIREEAEERKEAKLSKYRVTDMDARRAMLEKQARELRGESS